MTQSLDQVLAAQEKIQAQLANLTEKHLPAIDAAEKEARKAGELSEQTKAAVDKAYADINALSTKVTDLEQLAAAYQSHGVNSAKSVKDLLLASDNLKNFVANMPSSHGQMGQGISIPVQAALTTLNIGSGVLRPERVESVGLVAPKLYIRDLLGLGSTQGNSVDYVKVTGFTNLAEEVPESQQKPVSAIDYAASLAPVSTIAHLFKVSRQAFDDMAALASDIENAMMYGLKEVEQTKILFGTGANNTIHGIYTQATAFAAPAGLSAFTTNIDIIRVAMLQTYLAKMAPTGIVLGATDWAKIVLQKEEGTGAYVIGQPQGVAPANLWGLPVVDDISEDMQGKFLVGAFKTAAMLYDREAANIVIASENADDFEKNMLTVRCEERFALAVKRPEAFVKGVFA